jgi:glycosyltransferase involved in cell wall biosynthesis
LYRRADALIAMTDYERHWLIEQGAAAHKVHVVPMAPLFETEQVESEEAFRARYGVGSHPYIFFLGRMTQAKGVPPLLEAMPQLWQRYPDLRLVLAGPDDDLIQGAAAAVLTDPRVIHAGLIDGASKRAALSYCRCLCVPSTEESLGVIYLEAWAHGRPVIAADTPVMRAVIDAGQDGLLVAPQAADIAGAASQLLAQPEWADQLGERGRAKVQQCYSWESSASRLAAIYAQLAAQPRPQPA